MMCDLARAKNMFFEHACDHQYMLRNGTWDAYKAFHISSDQEYQWKCEYLDDKVQLASASTGSQRVWAIVRGIDIAVQLDKIEIVYKIVDEYAQSAAEDDLLHLLIISEHLISRIENGILPFGIISKLYSILELSSSALNTDADEKLSKRLQEALFRIERLSRGQSAR